MAIAGTSALKSVSIEAKIIRADGAVEDLGVISYWHANPLKRLAWRISKGLNMKESTEEIQKQLATLSKELEARKKAESLLSHFRDSEGKPIPNAMMDDALLRAIGIQLEKRLPSYKGWQEDKIDKIEAYLNDAVAKKSYVDVAMYAAVLSARQVITKE